jgi:hypothetical protein
VLRVAPVCNNNLNGCAIMCNCCEQHYCVECWWDDLARQCKCSAIHRCINYKDRECDDCGANTLYGSKDEDKANDDASVQGDGDTHPWHGIDFGDDLIDEFEAVIIL